MSKPLITALLLIFALPAIAADNQSIVRINDGDGAWRQRLGEHFGHLPRDRKRGEIVLQVDAADWRWLQTQGYAPRFDAALSAQLQTTLLHRRRNRCLHRHAGVDPSDAREHRRHR